LYKLVVFTFCYKRRAFVTLLNGFLRELNLWRGTPCEGVFVEFRSENARLKSPVVEIFRVLFTSTDSQASGKVILVSRCS